MRIYTILSIKWVFLDQNLKYTAFSTVLHGLRLGELLPLYSLVELFRLFSIGLLVNACSVVGYLYILFSCSDE